MSFTQRSHLPAACLALALVFMLCTGAAFAQHYTRTDLTADTAGLPNMDPNLVNAWGMSRGTGSPWWISDNGTGLTTLYDANGVPQSLIVTVAHPDGSTSAPTGTVFNAFNGAFEVAPTFRSIFLFATEDGTISGWNPNVNLNSTIIEVNHSKDGANYKGLAIGMTAGGPRLYVTNFASGAVEVYDSKFRRINSNRGFMDEKLPPNYAPFGIQNVGGNIVVTYAKRLPGEEDELHGPGLGYVNVYDLSGKLLLRLQHNSTMNAPWGIAQAPGDFGAFSHRLIIANFGDGFLHAYNAVSGKHEGQLLDANGAPIWIDGLWAISFGGNSTNNGMLNELYFTAGPNEENNGLLGKLAPVGTDQRGNSE